MKKLVLMLFLGALFHVGLSQATDTGESYEALYKLVHEAKYTEALAWLDKAGESLTNNYNRGVVLATMGKIGEARYYFELAHREAPRSLEIKQSLDWIKREILKSGFESEAAPSFFDNLTILNRFLTIGELVFVFLLFWTSLWVYRVYLFINKKPWLNAQSLFLVLFGFFSLFSLINKYYHEKSGKFGIIEKQGTLYETIIDQTGDASQFHEGQKFEVLDFQEMQGNSSRVKILLPSGKIGWVLQDNVRIL